jgi:hypothetical protein
MKGANMKKIKITKIVDNCEECPYLDHALYYCSKEKRKLDTPYHAIPLWCPFDNV